MSRLAQYYDCIPISNLEDLFRDFLECNNYTYIDVESEQFSSEDTYVDITVPKHGDIDKLIHLLDINLNGLSSYSIDELMKRPSRIHLKGESLRMALSTMYKKMIDDIAFSSHYIYLIFNNRECC